MWMMALTMNTNTDDSRIGSHSASSPVMGASGRCAQPSGGGDCLAPRRAARDDLLEPADQLRLRRVDPNACFVEREPLAAVHFGIGDPLSRSRRPLGARAVAHDRGRIQITLTRPGVHRLAGLLLHPPERNERTVERRAGLLLELAPGRGEVVLALIDDTLWNGPRTGV